MKEENMRGSPLTDAPGYEIRFHPAGKKREYLMGLWNGRDSRFDLEMVYSNLAEDRITLSDNTRRLLLHTTRRLRTGEYRYGCFEPGKGWLAEGEHLHVERILIPEKGGKRAETFWLWVYDGRDGRGRKNFYHHRLYDAGERLIGAFDSCHTRREPYEEMDYQMLNGSLVFREKKDGKPLVGRTLHQE